MEIGVTVNTSIEKNITESCASFMKSHKGMDIEEVISWLAIIWRFPSNQIRTLLKDKGVYNATADNKTDSSQQPQ